MANADGCTVLDEQRRMRPEIAELTRCEYEDVVTIVDHARTLSQRIGDATQSEAQQLESERSLWHLGGRAVPGVVPQVFFWDLPSKEGRASVGLSKCNKEEAEACAALCAWLLRCGVPARAISIITPYKGQKLEIYKYLRKVPGAVSKRFVAKHAPRRGAARGAPLPNAESRADIEVSTVDRFQGDENDIVILSLVCTKPGNRFVALRNRFIVAASRARIGCYIIGASAAVANGAKGAKGPPHWCRLLRQLADPAPPPPRGDEEPRDGGEDARDGDDEPRDAAAGVADGSRIGAALAICCPRHPTARRCVAASSDFPRTAEELGAFCRLACPFRLPWCGHACQLPCHSPSLAPHTTACAVLVPRPCEAHTSVPLRCGDANATRAASLPEALAAFKCCELVEYRRTECPHAETLPCHLSGALLAGTAKLDDCTKKVGDFAHPVCGHVRKAPTCHERRAWEDSPPKCLERVERVRECGCKVRLSCDEAVREASLDAPPRCLHRLTSRCHHASALREFWLEQDGESASTTLSTGLPLVVHGARYGPPESELGVTHPTRLNKIFPACRVKIAYRARARRVSLRQRASADLSLSLSLNRQRQRQIEGPLRENETPFSLSPSGRAGTWFRWTAATRSSTRAAHVRSATAAALRAWRAPSAGTRSAPSAGSARKAPRPRSSPSASTPRQARPSSPSQTRASSTALRRGASCGCSKSPACKPSPSCAAARTRSAA